MDCDLSFENHIYDKIKMANKMLGIIKRNFFGLDKFTFVMLFKGMVWYHIEYAFSVGNPHRLGLIRDIEGVQ